MSRERKFPVPRWFPGEDPGGKPERAYQILRETISREEVCHFQTLMEKVRAEGISVYALVTVIDNLVYDDRLLVRPSSGRTRIDWAVEWREETRATRNLTERLGSQLPDWMMPEEE